ncbi:hypothetical protein CSUB01_09936 [Colletotrichum sublineola]|uniref:Uncharacterized protein n=1 Tax=Colletotrichum sublineola TaxID=1173701 RepID=A0A066X269_COLSU|nr:hypothetical protein CSUB01_09936 [Colletotrichum sublineola]
MSGTETNNGDGEWVFLLYALAYFLALILNFVPFFLSQRADAHFPAAGALLKPLLLQLVEDTQESLMLLIQPLLDTFVADTLSRKSKSTVRDLIAKADSLNAVLKVWTIKFPSFIVTIASTLPRSWISLLAIPATTLIWFVWLWVFSDIATEVQDSKRARDKALKRMDREETKFQAEYLESLLQLNRKLVYWKAFRTLIITAFVLFFGHILDTTLVVRLIHQVASLESISWKETSSRTRASQIISEAVKKRDKVPDPEAQEGAVSELPAHAAAENAKISPEPPATADNDRLMDLTAHGRVGKQPALSELPDRQESKSLTSEPPNSLTRGRHPGCIATFALNAARVMVILTALRRASRKPGVWPQCSSDATASHPRQPQQRDPDQASGKSYESYGSISLYRGYDTFHGAGLRGPNVGEHEPPGAEQPDHTVTDPKVSCVSTAQTRNEGLKWL